MRADSDVAAMIPLATPDLTGSEKEYLLQCIETTFVSSVGAFVNRFEELGAKAAGAKFATATSSGTTALHAGLICLGVRRDDLVILPSYTFIASANAIAHCGATPWLFDVAENSWSLDPELLEKTLQSETDQRGSELIHRATGRRVGAVMPVYTLGAPARMDRIAAIARRFKLPVIADAAAALGARYQGQNLGGLADLTAFSFNGNKTVTAGGGGLLVSENESLIRRAKHICATARHGLEYEHDEVGYNYRMTNLQAAVGCAQLERLDEFVAKKRRVRDIYNRELGVEPGLRPFPQDEGVESACWFSGVLVDDDQLPPVTEINGKLKARGVESRSFWRPVHMQKPYASAPRTAQTISEKIWSKVLTLPSSTHLTASEQAKVIAALKDILRDGRRS